MFFTQDKVDKGEYPVRDPGSSSYLATFEPARRGVTVTTRHQLHDQLLSEDDLRPPQN